MSSKAPTPDPRPLSPHLQVWRWHATMATSIFHRASGIANYIGIVLFAAWLLTVSGGAQGTAFISGLFEGGLGWAIKLVLFLLTLGYSYHWINGLRHLTWDFGLGYDPKASHLRSWIIIALTPVPALLIWAVALGVI